ncbi:MAG: SAM-dependent methyltransferase [Betaproteobacteria bacterium HGW-Betaproteobacteria-22]|nr:MAG: SAM-dependent methyltransferase [Betaproteobacteria bacterium HGW-Betaproteobacteria-22]
MNEKQNAQNRWFDSELGRYLLRIEQALYDQAVVDLFGFNAVQMGSLQMDLLQNSRIAHRFRCVDFAQAVLQHDVCCDDDFLPFESMSLDLLLLPHRLEFSERPHQTLREAERVMMPEGYLLLSGFNPLSTWGARAAIQRFFSPRKVAGALFPWGGRFIGLSRLKDWLALLGFEVVMVKMCCHVPPFEQDAWRERFGFMDKFGVNWLAFIGGVYFVVAKKRVPGMTPLKPNWKSAPLSPRLIVRPTQSNPTQNEKLSVADEGE